MLVDFESNNPVRLVNWRWLDARHLVGRRGRLNRDDRSDEGFVQAVELRRALFRWHRDEDFEMIAQRMPHACAARKIWLEDGPMRWEIEARLLARQTDEMIAMRFGCDSEIISLYECHYFHVRDRLNAMDWILAMAVGTATSNLNLEIRKGIALRRLGYFGGPAVLDLMLPYILAFQEPVNARDLVNSGGSPEDIYRLGAAWALLPEDYEKTLVGQKQFVELAEANYLIALKQDPAAAPLFQLKAGLARKFLQDQKTSSKSGLVGGPVRASRKRRWRMPSFLPAMPGRVRPDRTSTRKPVKPRSEVAADTTAKSNSKKDSKRSAGCPGSDGAAA